MSQQQLKPSKIFDGTHRSKAYIDQELASRIEALSPYGVNRNRVLNTAVKEYLDRHLRAGAPLVPSELYEADIELWARFDPDNVDGMNQMHYRYGLDRQAMIRIALRQWLDRHHPVQVAVTA